MVTHGLRELLTTGTFPELLTAEQVSGIARRLGRDAQPLGGDP
jgi:hypothetical protein